MNCRRCSRPLMVRLTDLHIPQGYALVQLTPQDIAWCRCNNPLRSNDGKTYEDDSSAVRAGPLRVREPAVNFRRSAQVKKRKASGHPKGEGPRPTSQRGNGRRKTDVEGSEAGGTRRRGLKAVRLATTPAPNSPELISDFVDLGIADKHCDPPVPDSLRETQGHSFSVMQEGDRLSTDPMDIVDRGTIFERQRGAMPKSHPNSDGREAEKRDYISRSFCECAACNWLREELGYKLTHISEDCPW